MRAMRSQRSVLVPAVIAAAFAVAACFGWGGGPASGLAQEGAAKPDGESESAAGGESLAPGVYAKVNGREITEREYAQYLLASIGKAHLGRYIDRILIESESRRQGVSVTPEEVEKLVTERIDRTIQGVYRGNREAFLASLARRNMTLDERKQRDRQQIYYDRLLGGLILKQRKVDEATVQQEFERVYGPGGVQLELRHILVSTRRRIGADGARLPPRTAAEAKSRASKVHQELLGGADFSRLVERYSDDPLTRQNSGRVPIYRPGIYGAEFDAAVSKLTKESPLSGVVSSSQGLHLVQLVEKRETKLKAVKAEVEALVRNRPPSPAEKQDALATLRQAATIVR